MTSPTKFYNLTQITSYMRSCDQNLLTHRVNERSYHNNNFIRICLKTIFLRGALGSRSIFATGTRYGLESLHKCGKRVETES